MKYVWTHVDFWPQTGDCETIEPLDGNLEKGVADRAAISRGDPPRLRAGAGGPTARVGGVS
jgi:hypothetical protein